MASMDEIKVTFFEECRELLEDMEAGLIQMNEGDRDPERVNAVFRAAHSIKGGAGAFGFSDLVEFAHRFETTLDEVREGNLDTTPDVMAVFLRAADRLADLVDAARDDIALPDADEILSELSELTGSSPESEEESNATDDDAGFTPMSLDFGDIGATETTGTLTGYDIRFKPGPDLYRRGNEPALLLHALSHLGALSVATDFSGLPGLDADLSEMSPQWSLTLNYTGPEDEIREIFEFVEDDCDLTITAIMEESDATPFEPAPESNPPPPAEAPADATKDSPNTRPAVAQEKPDETAAARPAAKRAVGSIRVELERVDRLINLVGELVVNQAMLSQSVVEAGLTSSSNVASGLDEFKNLTREVQDSVMAIRAQPVRSLFQRMSRIVREGAAATNKNVRLVSEGEATEIDKTVIDMLADPLTHMIRNAIDHGLEGPDARAEAGKSDVGTVRLSAAHRSGRVVIEIADDGAGINRERVRAIAVEKGLISEDANLTPNEIDNLLFLPGFSTAKEVSNLSGRGVGMDVVKQAIQKLGGRISITSRPGHGSTFTISLPLTLAVLDGMVVMVDGQTLVVPLNSIVETLRPAANQVHTLGRAERVVHVRDSFVPIVDLGKSLGFSDPDKVVDREVYLLIEGEQTGQSALGLDQIVDQRQVVIKSLEDNYGHVDGVAAATILGNGRIALILDSEALMKPTQILNEPQALGGAA